MFSLLKKYPSHATVPRKKKPVRYLGTSQTNEDIIKRRINNHMQKMFFIFIKDVR
jgi:hypothetical protein